MKKFDLLLIIISAVFLTALNDQAKVTGLGVPGSEYDSLVDLYEHTNGSSWYNDTNWLDTMDYNYEISNPNVPGLILRSADMQLIVTKEQGPGIPISEYNALVDFYYSTNGDNWYQNDHWLDTTNYSVSDWYGITVKNNAVQYIAMDSNYVSGVLPSELGNLESLEGLGFVNNDIQGSLPGSLTNLSQLRYISMDGNRLTGPIPQEIGNLTHLRYLGLSDNDLTGEIPESIGQLTELDFIMLGHNNLSGTIPSSIGSLTKLRYLLLNDNQLTGPVPVELENLTKIIKLNLDNNLIGAGGVTQNNALLKNETLGGGRQIPDELANLISMDTLRLGNNSLMFNDIEPIFSWNNFEDLVEFTYYPQSKVGVEKTVESEAGETVTLSIDGYLAGSSDEYQWYKNELLIPDATNDTLNLTGLQLTDSGDYYCIITNPVATELTLQSRNISLAVQQTVGTSNLEKNDCYTIYPNPAQNRVFVDLNNEVADLRIYNMTGNLVFEIHNATSRWIDNIPFSKGVYCFRIIGKAPGDIVSRTVIFK